ncbi:Uncharacterised protein [Mycobacteroides abscessus subsp. abscessus]|nr:Uncharacterised protein [Mycobacteroides abscessus subsp. abscessus]
MRVWPLRILWKAICSGSSVLIKSPLTQALFASQLLGSEPVHSVKKNVP